MEISAPLAGGRDLVSERLRIEFDLVARRAAALEEAIRFAEAKVQAGVDAGERMAPLGIERAQLAVTAEQIRLDLAQRQSFLAYGSDVAPEPAR